MNEELRRALAEIIRQQTMTGAAGGGFAPPENQGPALPQVSLGEREGVRPEVRASGALPFGQGELTASGSYYRPNQQMPPDWSAMFGYKQPF